MSEALDKHQTGLASLSDGACFYALEGPSDGRRMLLVHGATVPHWQYDELVPFLHRAGFRTLRFDLLGHGESARPGGAYPLDRLSRQALELLEYVGWRSPDAVFGHSLGGAVSVALLELLGRGSSDEPGLSEGPRLPALILSAPLLDAAAAGLLIRFLRVPVLGGVVMRVYGMRALAMRRRRRFEAIGRSDLVERYRAQAERPGFREALVSLARHGALGPHQERYAALGELPGRRLVLWGDEDAVVPRAHVDQIATLLGGAPLRTLRGLEHNMLLTDPEQLAGATVEFLNDD